PSRCRSYTTGFPLRRAAVIASFNASPAFTVSFSGLIMPIPGATTVPYEYVKAAHLRLADEGRIARSADPTRRGLRIQHARNDDAPRAMMLSARRARTQLLRVKDANYANRL